MSWIKDIVDPETRSWEDFYRNRWQHDRVVRSTHGVNCTGGCSWNIHVKDGIVTWEMQALDYPTLDAKLPPYEPRGCQRGISYSWYLYSPLRVKYPYVRGVLIDLWRRARREHEDPVAAWAAIQTDSDARASYQRARGKGGFRRASWEELLEIIAAANIYTAKTYGPDRVIGFSPIPAMSMLSYAGGSRFLQLFGGVNLSFYDWYCDLPPASPEIWGEQTDVAESADWYNSKFTAVVGSNLAMTRTPDCHFAAEARHNGTKLVVFAPDFNMVAKYADQWIPIHAGQDGAFWMSVAHVILDEFHHQRPVPAFLDYVKRFTDAPFLVTLEPDPAHPGHYRAGQLLRANRIARYTGVENGDWKFLVWDALSGAPRMPGGSVGHRWQQAPGAWNLELRDPTDGAAIDPRLSLLGTHEETLAVRLVEFGSGREVSRGVPARHIETAAGPVAVTTAYDLLFAQYGVGRGLSGDYPATDGDENAPYTPAWQEKWTGISRATVLQFAREWARTAEATGGRCCIIIGAGANHWFHNNLIYRAGIVTLMLTGCVGKNGGGLNHYVGQEKLAPMVPWSAIALAKDWGVTPRLQNAPSFHYLHGDQWRYDAGHATYTAGGDDPFAREHTADTNVRAVRAGWLPFYPQWPESSLEAAAAAARGGARSPAEIAAEAARRMAARELRLSVEDPDAPASWPRVFYIWRGNALLSSAKGHEYFLKHYLGTHHNDIAEEAAKGRVTEVAWHEQAPTGKMDLIVDLNFRMDTSALYSDIVLPAASWYEKADLNTTDMHSYIHPLSAATPPVWESRTDWDIFKAIARETSKQAARHIPGPVADLVTVPLSHDSPDEMAQTAIRDWGRGECQYVPGRTGPKLAVVERDYTKLYDRFCALGPGARAGLGLHGVKFEVADFYDRLAADGPSVEVDGLRCPAIGDAADAANAILALAPETNGEISWRGFAFLEKKTGLRLTDLAEGARQARVSYRDLQSQPRRVINSPIWSGLVEGGRAYAAFTLNVERGVPWRTLTGRQHFYLDHPGYIAHGENLPTYKPSPRPEVYGDLDLSRKAANGSTKVLNLLTPHGKWHIHSTYGDTLRMMTLSRGCSPFWMNDADAAELGIGDNDWVEIHNDNGVMVTRAIVSARIPRDVCMIYHAPERTLNVPRSPLRGGRRAGGHNSLNRIRLKPNLMVGGYGQFTYHFNYWGPTGVNRDTHVLVRRLSADEVKF